MHALGHGIRLDAGLAQLPADAALLDAAKGHAVVGVVAAVDPDHAGLDVARDALVDAGVGGEGGAGIGAAAVEDVEDAARQAGGGHEAGEIEHGQGRLLGGLEDERVAGGEGRGQLPAGHGQRVVPGDDLSADAERLAQRVGKLGGAEIHGLAVPLVGPAGIVAEHGHEVWDVLGEARRQGLAVVERLNGGQRQGVGLDEVGEVVEELAPCRGRQVTPGRVLKGGTGGGDGRVDVGFCGCMD
ncbi:hypothetical protein BN1708_009496 [Verticillium longisporum]|uniref:Uncharacterized protein n=1 Tax=Verticillium longisporum TaxID=100787 RepID=A0A0G4KIC5_VERLO|nr:hypothetical protein BN1708_009496 [Verticillium longisporum]